MQLREVENLLPRNKSGSARRVFAICAMAVAALFCAGNARAVVTVTPATSGTGIPADKAQNAVAPAFTTLGGITITENSNGDFSNPATLILAAPAGWRFNAGVGSASFVAGNNITAASISVSATSVTVNVTVSGTNKKDTLTISGIQVQATEGGNIPATGNILAATGTANIAGVVIGTTNFGALSQTAGALRLYVVLPGQSFTDAATVAGSGISGTAAAQTAGTPFNLTKLVAADRQFNIDGSYTGAKTISYTGPGGTPSYTTAVTFSSGQSSTTLATTLTRAETTSITAGDGSVTGVASSTFTVNPGAFARLQLLVPGETAAPGTLSGKTGSPSAQDAGISFNVSVNAVDGNWNVISSVSDTVQITSSDAGATLPSNAALSGGTHTFSVTLNTAGNQTVTATNVSNGSITSDTSPSIFVNKTPTTTVAASSLNPATFGQVVTFTAVVTQVTGSITPTGPVTFKDGAATLGSENLDGGGQAIFTILGLAAGSHPISAVYNGDDNYQSSTSVTFTQIVNKVGTATVVASSPNPSASGQSVTFTATVTVDDPSAGNPTGNVTFKDGAATLGTGTLIAGQASFSTASLSVGSHPNITATYNGGANFLSSTSAAITQTVTQAGSTTTLVSSANPSVFGQPVTFTATVTAAGTPTGPVSFEVDGSPVTNITLNGSGQAAFVTSSLSVGAHTLRAVYGGDTNFTGSASGNLAQNVNQAATTTTVSSSLNPSTFGQSVTFTGTVNAVSPGAGMRTGNLTFRMDGVDQAPVSINGSGVGVFSVSSLSVTNHIVSATYSGDGNFTGSTSADFAQTVNKAASSTVVTSSANPSVLDDAVTFTATVTGPGGTPTGSVIFRDGATPLATNAISAGQATYSTSSLAVGTHSITAVYSGDESFNTSTSSTLTQTVNRKSTTTTLISSLNPSVFGQSVTFTATVSSPGGTPTGSVIFQDGATVLATNSLSAGQATFSTAAFIAGNHPITAVYTGDASFTNSTSAALTQTVAKADTATTLGSSTNPTVFGQPIIFTASVTVIAPGAGTPTGTVSFKDGAATLATIALSAGQAVYTNSTLTTGAHTISAVFNGSTNFNASTSSNLSQTVNKADTTTDLASSVNPSVFGQSVTFTATVSPVPPGAGTRTGTVSFSVDGGAPTAAAVNASGQATLTTATLSAGNHTVSATYNGDANFTGSTSSVLTQTVNKASTTTAITSSLNPSVFGQSVTFTGTVSAVSPGAGTRTGSLTFTVDGVAQSPVSINAAGIGTLAVSGLSTGSHVVAASYTGDGNFNGSASVNFTQTVNRATSTTTVNSSANPSVFGQSVTFTATVSGSGGTPTGTVIFRDGAAALATNTLSAGQTTFTISTLTIGAHSITVEYSGDQNFSVSSSGALSQMVNRDNTTTTVSSSANPSAFGQLVTFTATVAALPPGSGTPSGSVILQDGAVGLATNSLTAGQATFNTSTLAVGSHSITVVYTGDAAFTNSTSAVLTQSVAKANTVSTFVSSVNPSVFGQPVIFNATVSAAAPGSGTPTGTVSFKDGAATLATTALSAGQAVYTNATLNVGDHEIAVTYNGDGNFTNSTSAVSTQTVHKASTTTALASSANPSVFGQSVTFTATVTAVAPGAGTRTGTVAFSIDGAAPTNVTVNASGQATLTTAALSVGGHAVSATYSGDASFAGSTATDLSQNVNPAATTTTVSSSLNPSLFGQSVTFTGTVSAVSPGAGTRTGNLTFSVDGVPQPPVSINASGQATFSTSALSVTNHIVTATYSGDGNFTGSTSANFTQTVNRTSSATVLTSSSNPSVFGEAVTFTATVSGTGGTPSGMVVFLDGAVALATNTLSAGQTTFITSALAVGAHSITAVYNGDQSFSTNTSAVLTQTVNRDPTTTSVSSSANPSVFGQSVSFTATVTANAPGAGTPTGTVVFRDSATALATNTLVGGQATFSTASLTVSNHAITVVYNGDGNFTNSMSGVLNQIVNKADTTTTLASSVNPSVFGQAVTFTATVNPVVPGTGTRTGTVAFSVDGGAATNIAVNASGQAALTSSALSVGNHTIAATYSGDGNFNGSTASTLTQSVNQALTTTTVSSSLNPSLFGQSVTFTGTVSVVSPGAGTRTGNLTFTVDGVAQSPVSINAAGIGTLVVSGLSTGNHVVAASYGGDGSFAGSSSGNFTQTVNRAGSTTAVSSSANPSVFGQSVTFTATVSGSGGTPSGTVVFRDGAVALATNTLSGGQTTLTLSTLSVASHVISVVYNGDGNFSGSTSSNLTQVVNKATTTTSLTSSLNPACPGQTLVFTATVAATAPGTGTPTGTVTLRDGGTILATLTLNAGQVSFTNSSLSVGVHTLNATYNGSTEFNTSVSASLAQTIGALPACSITGTNAVCANATGIIYTAPAGMSAYSWTISGAGAIAGTSTEPSVSVTAGSSGSFTLSLAQTGTNGCSSACSTTVTINIPPVITANPTNRTVCAGSSVSFTAAATGSPAPTVRWQVSTNGGASFTNVVGGTGTTYTFITNAGQNGNQYRAVFTNPCGTATTTPATLTVSAVDATISADAIVCKGSTNNVASVPDAGLGASYSWTVSGGTVTVGAGTRSITYTAPSVSSSFNLSVTVSNALGCVSSSTRNVLLASQGESMEAWRNKAPLQWQSSTFNSGDHVYADDHSIPFRMELKQLCAGSAWCVVLQYDFSQNNSARHFIDFLTTYNTSEATVNGHECDNFVCNGEPTTYPIPVDPSLSYQIPGVFTVYNGTITNISEYTTVLQNSTIDKQLIISGTAGSGTGVRDVLILFGAHLGCESQWGTGNGADSFPGASAKVYYKYCGESSFGNFDINPGGIVRLADLSITKAGSPDPVCPGGLLNYSLSITNYGCNQATGVSVLDQLPPLTTVVSASAPFTGTTNLTFSLGTLNAGSGTNITLVVSVAASATGSLTNTATVSLASPVDPFLGNNTATAITRLRVSPNCLITGPNALCPGTTNSYAGPAGMIAYRWSMTGNGVLVGATNNPTVTVAATAAGSFTLTLSVTDAEGCESVCQEIVAVENTGAPLLICAEDRQLQCGESTSTNNTGRATATGSCGTGGDATVTFFDVLTPATCTGREGIDRIWTATNQTGESSVCTQHITFVDRVVPVITCPSNITVNADAGQCHATGVALGSPIASDNCGVASVTNNAPSQFPVGATTVTWTVTDNCGNHASCAQTVTVLDTQPPTIECPANITTNIPAGPCGIVLDLGTPVTADNCSVASVGNNAPAQFFAGTTLVIWTATDPSGNAATCTQQVVVTQPATIPCYLVQGYNPITTFSGCNPETGTGEHLWSGRLVFNGDQWDTTSERTSWLNTGNMQMDQDVLLVYDGCVRRLILYYTNPDDSTYENILWTGLETNAGSDVYEKTDGCASIQQVVLEICESNDCSTPTITFPSELPINCTDEIQYCASISCSNCVFSTLTPLPGNLVLTPEGCVTGVVGCATAGSYTNSITIKCSQVTTNINLIINLSCPLPTRCPDSPPLCRHIAGYTNTMFDGSSCTNCTDLSGGSNEPWDGVVLLGEDPHQCRWVVDPAKELIVVGGRAVNVGNAICGEVGVVLTPETFVISCYNAETEQCTVLWQGAPACDGDPDVYVRTGGCSPIPATLTIEDCPALAMNCPVDIVSECAADVVLSNAMTIGGCSHVSITNSAPSLYSTGTNLVVWTAFDDCRNSVTCTQRVIIAGSSAPSFAGLQTITPAIEGATLNWQPAIPSNVTYHVYESTSGGAQSFATPLLSTTNLTVFVSPLSPGTTSPITYFFIVRATDACGNSDANTVELSVQPLLDPAKDQDGDGLPNGFEQQHGLNPFNAGDAALDADGDGMSNLHEFLAGTDPTNSASFLAITSLAREGVNLRVTWITGLGKFNALQRSIGDAPGFTNNFADIFTISNTTSTTTNYLDIGVLTNAPSFYYRVRLVP